MKTIKKINWKPMLFKNWLLKLISFIFAFILWFVVITEEDPVDTKTFYGIKVNLLNTEKLEELGRVYEVLDGTDTLRSVTVEAPGSVLDKMEAGDIVAEADLNHISGMNTVEISFYSPSYNRDIIGIEGNISNVKLSIEDKVKKSLYIRHEEIGEVAEGHIVGGITLEHTRLEVEGPASKISQVSKAVVSVDVSGAITDFATPLAVDLLDENGNKLTYESVQQSVETVNVNAKVLKLKDVPVEYVVHGVPAEGYLATGVVETDPATVTIAGSLKVINRINKIVVKDELDLTGATETLNLVIDLESDKFLNGAVLADDTFDGNAHVKIYVEKEQEKNFTLKRDRVQILNVPEYLNAEIVINQTMPTLQVKGLAKDVGHLREGLIEYSADVAAWMLQQNITELAPGIYSIPVQFQLTEGQNAVNEVAVEIQFTEKVEEINE